METKRTKTQGMRNGIVLLAALVMMLSSLGLVSRAMAVTYTCLPTCETDDVRFLAVAGTQLQTLAGQELNIEFAASSTASLLQIGIFDGNTGGLWDLGTTPLEYILYADPNGDGKGTVEVGRWLGNAVNATAGPLGPYGAPVWTSGSATMPDSGWWTLTVNLTNSPPAQAPSGNYFYRLKVHGTDPSVRFWSNFKVRTDGVVSIHPYAFAFAAPLNGVEDARFVYPSWDGILPIAPEYLADTPYNGEFDFHVYVPGSTSFFSVWDGDLDHGSLDCTVTDDDDPDTGHIRPPWAAGTAAVPQGIATSNNPCRDAAGNIIVGPGGRTYATGAPADNNRIGGPYTRSPNVTYTVIDPNGNPYVNHNPSGNLEWEQFRIDTNPAPAPFAGPDSAAVTNPLPSGVYHIHMQGMDLQNLNAWRFFYDVVGVCADGSSDGHANPCKPLLQPYIIGDTVWHDTNRNGLQDNGEAGIPGVVVELLDGNGQPVHDIDGNPITAVTDAQGHYSFPVQGQIIDVNPFYDPNDASKGPELITYFDGVYTVHVASSNFTAGGPLYQLFCTTGSISITKTVINQNIYDLSNTQQYDFGYALNVDRRRRLHRRLRMAGPQRQRPSG